VELGQEPPLAALCQRPSGTDVAGGARHLAETRLSVTPMFLQVPLAVPVDLRPRESSCVAPPRAEGAVASSAEGENLVLRRGGH
jgi:hypothetical protein